MIRNTKNFPVIEAILCTFGFMVFSYFIHDHFPKLVLSFAGISIPAYIVSRKFHTLSELFKILGLVKIIEKPVLFILSGILTGFLISALYLHKIGMPVIPSTLKIFVFTGALIGTLEELIFRGFIQGQIEKINPGFSVLFASMSHTAYKACLFLPVIATQRIDLLFLVVWTFVGGLAFGLLKMFSKSVIPPILAHATFDIITYAHWMSAPWWVW